MVPEAGGLGWLALLCGRTRREGNGKNVGEKRGSGERFGAQRRGLGLGLGLETGGGQQQHIYAFSGVNSGFFLYLLGERFDFALVPMVVRAGGGRRRRPRLVGRDSGGGDRHACAG